MATTDLANIASGDRVTLTAPDGHRMTGIFDRYVPESVRYQFKIFIGGNKKPTNVLFSKATIAKYTIKADNSE